MTDLLIASFAFVLLFEFATVLIGAVLAVSAPLDRACRGCRGHLPLLAAAAVACGGTAFALTPHALGVWTGHYHAVADRDLAATSAPAWWAVALLALAASRVLWQLVAEARLSWRLRRARVNPPPVLATRLAAALERCPLSRRPRVVVHTDPRCPGPFLRGLWRPTIHLHIGLLRRLEVEQLAAVIAHEANHRDGGDHVTAWLDALLFRPLNLVPSLRRRYREWQTSREFACDDAAAAAVRSPRAVARAIVEVLRFALATGPDTTAVAAFAAEADVLRLRVSRLVHGEPGRGSTTAGSTDAARWWVAVGLLAGVSATALAFAPQLGLGLFCSLEHTVGTHCL